MSATRVSNREKFAYYNSLSILLKAVEGNKTTIDLRNEAYIYGTVGYADGFMNVTMDDCIFTDPRGDKFRFDTFFVQARNIRCVHIPPHIPIVPAINNQLEYFKNSNRTKNKKRTFKMKRARENLKEDTAAVQEILEKRGMKGKNDDRTSN